MGGHDDDGHHHSNKRLSLHLVIDIKGQSKRGNGVIRKSNNNYLLGQGISHGSTDFCVAGMGNSSAPSFKVCHGEWPETSANWQLHRNPISEANPPINKCGKPGRCPYTASVYEDLLVAEERGQATPMVIHGNRERTECLELGRYLGISPCRTEANHLVSDWLMQCMTSAEQMDGGLHMPKLVLS